MPAFAHDDQAAMGAHISALEMENRACAQRCRAATSRNRQLVEVAIASQRLNESRSRSDVYSALESLFTNLFDTRELAILEADGDALRLVSALGAGARLGPIRIGFGAIGRIVTTRPPYLADIRAPHLSPEDDTNLEIAAVVPLHVGNCVVGAVVALGSDVPPDSRNDELLALVSRQAALAFWSAVLDAPPSTRPTKRLR